MEKLDLLIKNGEVWTPGGFVEAAHNKIAAEKGKAAEATSQWPP